MANLVSRARHSLWKEERVGRGRSSWPTRLWPIIQQKSDTEYMAGYDHMHVAMLD